MKRFEHFEGVHVATFAKVCNPLMQILRAPNFGQALGGQANMGATGFEPMTLNTQRLNTHVKNRI